jgi:hypothetical protein
VKLSRFRKTKVTCFLSYVEDRSNKNTSIITYAYMFPKVGLLKETIGGGKREKNNRDE